MKKECEYCERYDCHGDCQNYILTMVDKLDDRSEFDKLFKQIPKFNYVLDSKISGIFGTDLEVATGSTLDEQKTEEFSKFLYRPNKNGNTNLSEIKKALREKEIFGTSYLFYDNEGLYFVPDNDLALVIKDDNDPIINEPSYYKIGDVDIPEDGLIDLGSEGFIKQDGGYIVSKDNIIEFKTETFVLNSDLKQLQILLEINKKIYESTTLRDYGDLFLFTNEPKVNAVSAVASRVKDTINEAIEKMREHVASLIKRNKVSDSNIVSLDESYRDVKQFAPITKVTDYQFIWEKQDDIISSVLNYPAILSSLGNVSGDVSKEALLKDARANKLTPLKQDVSNSLSKVARKMFSKEYYLRFKDYEEVVL